MFQGLTKPFSCSQAQKKGQWHLAIHGENISNLVFHKNLVPILEDKLMGKWRILDLSSYSTEDLPISGQKEVTGIHSL